MGMDRHYLVKFQCEKTTIKPSPVPQPLAQQATLAQLATTI